MPDIMYEYNIIKKAYKKRIKLMCPCLTGKRLRETVQKVYLRLQLSVNKDWRLTLHVRVKETFRSVTITIKKYLGQAYIFKNSGNISS